MTELYRHIGPNTDVPAGDIGVGAKEIGYLFGQYKRIKNEFTGILTGKGLAWGGSLIRKEATGYGSVYFAQEMLTTRNDHLKGKTCVVSGSGNVAQYTVEKLNELGAKVVTLSDSSGFIYDSEGITSEKLAFIFELKNVRKGRIQEYAEKYNVSFYKGQKPWSIKCDMAFPSATQNEIDENDAQLLLDNGCFVVCEGANMPSTNAAIDKFLQANILYGPAKAANAGGVATSALEMSQNSSRLSWSSEDVDMQLKKIMKDIHHSAYQASIEYGDEGNYALGANIAGFVKVADAMLEQGLV